MPDDTAAPVRPSHVALHAILRLVAAAPGELEPILNASTEALVAFDRDRRILAANAGAEELFGYAAGTLRGTLTDALVPERFRQPGAPPVAATSDVMQVEVPGRRFDGSELPVEWAFASTPTPSGPVFVMTVRDRAATDRALDALRASEERFRLLVDGVRGYALLMLDPAGRVSSWNAGAERSKGWGADEILGQSYEVFFTPEDRASGVPQRLLELAAREGHHEAAGWRVRKDGSRFLVSSALTALRSPTGELRGFAKITRDLADELQAQELEWRLGAERAGREAAEVAERRARESEDRLRRLQRATAALSEAATPADVASVVIEQSLQALGATGGAVYVVSADGTGLELLGQHGHPTLLQQFPRMELALRSPLTDAVRDRRPAFYASFEECAVAFPDLRDAIGSGGFEASAALPLLAHGAVLGVLGIRFPTGRAFDAADRSLLVTLSDLCAQALDRSRLFAAEREARAASESANRSKDEFLAMFGHELRNPLAPIVTALSLMRLRGVAGAEKERAVIERQVTHLVRLVDDLLDVSRITQGKVELKKERVELAVVVARAVELASPLLEQRQHYLALAVPPEGLEVLGDPTRLAQVLSNLVINAAKYTRPGGHISIAGAHRDGRVVLTVTDDGMGIDAAMLPHVFELFAQERQGIERSQGGLGLGLAVVKSLVAMHDGTVSASSEGRGKGSTFTVDLPAAAELDSQRRALAAAAVPAPSSEGGRRVLIVDDNPDAAELLAELLRAKGHEIVIAHDGPGALQLAGSFRPEVALLDIGLPVMDGYELARRLRSDVGAMRLIAVTGYGQDSDRARAFAAGFDAHMIKPVEPDALEAAIG